MTENTNHVAVTHGMARTTRESTRERDLRERAELIANAIGADVQDPDAKPDPAQRVVPQAPSLRPLLASDADVRRPGRGSNPTRKDWEAMTPAERAQDAADQFRRIATHVERTIGDSK